MRDVNETSLSNFYRLQGSIVPGHAARALWNLTSKHAANKDAARVSGAVPRLVSMLGAEHTQVRACSRKEYNCFSTLPLGHTLVNAVGSLSVSCHNKSGNYLTTLSMQ